MSAVDTRLDEDEEWLAWRLAGITASDVSNAYTGRYGGAYGVVAAKLGLVPPPEVTERMERGHRWEQTIADGVHVLHGYYVMGEQAWCENTDHPRHRATVDGMLAVEPEATLDDIEALLETKTTGKEVRASWDAWKIQCQWQMWCTGVRRVLIARAVIDDDTDELLDLNFRWVDRDDRLIADLVDLANELWGHVQARTLPDPDTPTALDIVKTVTATVDEEQAGEVVDLSDLYSDAVRFEELKTLVPQLTSEKEQLDALLRSRLGGATKGTAPGFDITLSKPRRVLTDEGEAAVLAARPDLGKTVLDRDRAKSEAKTLYEGAREAIGARVLTIKPAKEQPE